MRIGIAQWNGGRKGKDGWQAHSSKDFCAANGDMRALCRVLSTYIAHLSTERYTHAIWHLDLRGIAVVVHIFDKGSHSAGGEDVCHTVCNVESGAVR